MDWCSSDFLNSAAVVRACEGHYHCSWGSCCKTKILEGFLHAAASTEGPGHYHWWGADHGRIWTPELVSLEDEINKVGQESPSLSSPSPAAEGPAGTRSSPPLLWGRGSPATSARSLFVCWQQCQGGACTPPGQFLARSSSAEPHSRAAGGAAWWGTGTRWRRSLWVLHRRRCFWGEPGTGQTPWHTAAALGSGWSWVSWLA